MGFLDSIADRLGGKKDITGQHIQLKVCMMGPRAVGKTTILTSIFHDSDKKLVESGLYFKAVGATESTLNKGYEQLSNIFDHITDESATPLPGVDATKSVTTFDFQLGLKGQGTQDKRSSVDINITDFPGEFMDENHPEHQKVTDYISESQVILVAIDTVHLMEEDGIYNEARNRSEYLCKKMAKQLNNLPETERKLILLVPLKCEKYAIEQRLDEVDKRVKVAYATLIDEIEKEKFNRRMGLFITPIQTLGGVVFDCFGRDESGNVIIDPTDNCPHEVRYRFHRVIPGHKPMYMPAFCIQPLYYLVTFALSQYKYQKDQGGILSNMLKGIFALFSSDLKFYQACMNFVSNIKLDGHGFQVLNNPNFVQK